METAINKKRGTATNLALITVAILSAVGTSAASWIVNNVLDSPKTQAASVGSLETRVIKLETLQASTDSTTKNQGNKLDFVVGAVQKIGTRLNVDVGSPPINQ